MNLELSVADHQCDVTEGGTFKEKTQLVTESTGGNLDWSDARLTSHVHRLTNHTYLHTQTDIVLHGTLMVGWLAQLAERRSLAGELTLSYARPAADG